MTLNTHEAAQRREGKSEETESQDHIVGTDTCVQEAHKSAASLTLSAGWGKADNDEERLSNAEFAAEEEELEHYAGLAQKQLERHIQKIQVLMSCKQKE